MAKPLGPKELQRRAFREALAVPGRASGTNRVERPRSTAEPTLTPPPAPPAATQENTVKKPTKKAATKRKPAAKKKAKAPAGARADGLREGSKQAIMIDMALRGEGATEKAICKKLGWKKCKSTLGRVAAKVGATLTSSKNVAGDVVWFATMPKKAA